ncbi:MAG: glycoside hydrolase family 127 protein [Kiritimatiellae bacterium]|nr:glycoside hydrolase family 127 protein [Kiritimatiellia bacterium]
MAMKNKSTFVLAAAVAFAGGAFAAEPHDYPIRAAALTQVKVTGGFWFDRIETNRTATLKSSIAKCNETPRIANFTNAANRAWGTFGGIYFDDSDVFKVMEGAAYLVAQRPDPELEKYVDWFVGQAARAQQPDGYLYNARTLGAESVRKTARWEGLSWTHELYNQGHMIEAAVAWYEATGKTNFLDVAVKSADLMCRTFGWDPTQLKLTSGHQEIELALCKLYRATGRRKYLDLAKFFLDVRGRGDLRATWGAGVQDHLPVLEQDEAIGHAVRAGYLYTGMADVSALTGDKAYENAVLRLWGDVTGKKLYLTGGIGARHRFKHPKWGEMWEAFNGPYDLPNDWGEAYLETCAAIANILWNQRMFLAYGETKYVDVMELGLHNGFVSGISLSGDEFFYPNPLASKGGYKRSKWFGTSCCPVNDVRMIPQVPSMAWAADGKKNVYWNLFMAGTASVGGFSFAVDTDYPWSGKIALKVVSAPAGPRTLKVRIPGWATGSPVPSDLYAQTDPASFMEVAVAVNGAALNGCPGKDGYVSIGREWKAGDAVTVDLPTSVKRVKAHSAVKQDVGRLAVMRGPIVYCAEGCDNGGKAYDATLPADATFTDDAITIGGKTYPALKASNGLKLVPYCLWDNREPGNEMQVWFKE